MLYCSLTCEYIHATLFSKDNRNSEKPHETAFDGLAKSCFAIGYQLLNISGTFPTKPFLKDTNGNVLKVFIECPGVIVCLNTTGLARVHFEPIVEIFTSNRLKNRCSILDSLGLWSSVVVPTINREDTSVRHKTCGRFKPDKSRPSAWDPNRASLIATKSSITVTCSRCGPTATG